MTPRLLASTALLTLLAGCSFYEEGDGTTTGPVGSAGDATCSEDIYEPVGAQGTGFTELAPLHQDVYGDAPDPFQVRLQWPTSRPDLSAGFLWRTDVDTLATVAEFWVDGEEPTRVEGATFVFGDTDTFDGYRMHEVRLCGMLAPNTTYNYRVGGDSAWSDTYTFTTPEPPGTFDTVTVAIAGDSRGAYTTWASIVELMEAHDPDLYMFSGDMVDLGVSQGEWDGWIEAAGDLWTSKVMVPAHGNHEFLAKNYFAQFALPGNEEWFSVDYGPLHVISLNDWPRSENDLFTFQTNFMDSDLAASDATWTFAEHHSPIYSACSRHGSRLDIREEWAEQFEKGVDVVFAGHNHIYERSKPIRAGEESQDGVVYVVSGGGGAPLYEEVEDSWWNQVANPIEHYIIAEISGNTATFTARDLDDNVIDTFTLTK